MKGNRIYLSQLELSLIDGNYPRWFDDEEVCKANGHIPFTKTKQDFIDYINKVIESKNDYVFAIKTLNNNCHIGNVSIQKINWEKKDGELAIIIGEKDYWNRGYGYEAWKLVIGYGFDCLKLKKLYCGTYENNFAMQKLALKSGMKHNGRLSKAVEKNGKLLDILTYEILNKHGK